MLVCCSCSRELPEAGAFNGGGERSRQSRCAGERGGADNSGGSVQYQGVGSRCLLSNTRNETLDCDRVGERRAIAGHGSDLRGTRPAGRDATGWVGENERMREMIREQDPSSSRAKEKLLIFGVLGGGRFIYLGGGG